LGFLKFLKKKKGGEGVSGLDLPPAPPAFEDISDDHLDSDIPSFEDDDFFNDSVPKQAPISKQISSSKYALSTKIPSEENKGYDFDTDIDLEAIPELPPPPSFAEKSEDDFPETPFEKPKSSLPQKNIIQKKPDSLPVYDISKPTDFSRPSFQISGAQHTPVSRGKAIYVPMDQFKDVIRGINSIRLSITGIEHTFRKIEEIENTKEKSFNSLSLIMQDLQKRLIYVDKKLVSGGD